MNFKSKSKPGSMFTGKMRTFVSVSLSMCWVAFVGICGYAVYALQFYGIKEAGTIETDVLTVGFIGVMVFFMFETCSSIKRGYCI